MAISDRGVAGGVRVWLLRKTPARSRGGFGKRAGLVTGRPQLMSSDEIEAHAVKGHAGAERLFLETGHVAQKSARCADGVLFASARARSSSHRCSPRGSQACCALVVGTRGVRRRPSSIRPRTRDASSVVRSKRMSGVVVSRLRITRPFAGRLSRRVAALRESAIHDAINCNALSVHALRCSLRRQRCPECGMRFGFRWVRGSLLDNRVKTRFRLPSRQTWRFGRTSRRSGSCAGRTTSTLSTSGRSRIDLRVRAESRPSPLANRGRTVSHTVAR